jgi:Rieske Fe-S protein
MQRRGFLVGTSAALALSGCAAYGDTQDGTAAPEQPAADGTATPEQPAADGTATPEQPAAPALVSAADIPVGGGKIFADQKVVVTQPKKGTFKCFTAICTHAGCTVGEVKGGTINCPCHGSQFKIADGSVADGPAPKPLAPVNIAVDGDSIRLK